MRRSVSLAMGPNMPIIIIKDYSEIPSQWFLGDIGHLTDFNQDKPAVIGEFHPQLARLFLEYIQIGLTDRQACLQVPMNEKWPRAWGRGSMQAPDAYITALNDFAKPLQFDVMANDVVDIADGSDALANEDAIIAAVDNPLAQTLKKTVRPNVAKYRKMVGDRIAARKWYVSKMASSKYGDKVQLDHGNVGGKPFKHVDFTDLTIDQLEKLADLDSDIQKGTTNADND